MAKPISGYAQLNARIMPIVRGERFETPLEEALTKKGYGAVAGGGTMQFQGGEIQYCGIDIDFFDLDKGPKFVCEFLTARGAPKGSKLLYEKQGKQVELPFGAEEGIAIYLNGTDLPNEVYQECDINLVIETIDKLLGKNGKIRGYWQGPTETALYLYGKSAAEMQQLIGGFVEEYPLCQKARIEEIA